MVALRMAKSATLFLWFGDGWVDADPIRSDAKTAIVALHQAVVDGPIVAGRVQVLSPDTWENTRPDADPSVADAARVWVAEHQFYAEHRADEWVEG
jgi:hypothetical protein